jgi:hypothetical protein
VTLMPSRQLLEGALISRDCEINQALLAHSYHADTHPPRIGYTLSYPPPDPSRPSSPAISLIAAIT